MSLVEPEFPCGNFPTRKCIGGCADFCERFPWMLPNHEPLGGSDNEQENSVTTAPATG